MKRNSRYFVLILLIVCFGVTAQEKDKKEPEKDKKEKSGKEKMQESLKNSILKEGIFKVYQDTLDGAVRILLTQENLNKEYIYFCQIENGIPEFRLVKGNYEDSFIFTIEKYYNKLEFVRQNTSYYFDKNNPLYKSKESNISKSVLASYKVEASDEKEGSYLIKADDLFMNETFLAIKPTSGPSSNPFEFKLGNLDKDKSKIMEVKNYSDNLNVKSEYVYSQGTVLNGGSDAVTDARNVSVQVFHSIIAVPQNNFQPRFDDPRIGYFITQTNDQTSKENINYRDFIHRWNLVKKNPNQALSEPVTPITWWIENTTPYEFRDLVKEGVLRWNKAFEQAGFKNAMVVEVQPDDTDWDAGDIHYNVLRWTSSPYPAFGGYGPSFVNPTTGEILGADIMLEYVHHTNRVFYSKIFDAMAIQNLDPNEYKYCSEGHLLNKNVQLGRTILQVNGAAPEELNRMQKEAMLELVMHEIGHTLGLNHNMKASYLYSPDQLYDKNFAKDRALTGSVMDYVLININPDTTQQGSYFSTEVGPYDIWAIQYGYTPDLTEQQLENIAERSNEPELIFGNDADDMRSPGKAMDPRVMVDDISNDPLRYNVDRMNFVMKKIPQLQNTLFKENEFYEDYRRGFYTLANQYWNCNAVVSRYIGGVYINRSTPGQNGEKAPYIPVEYSTQKKAMQIINTYAFSKNAFQIPAEIWVYMAQQRRGFNFFSGADDPKVFDNILNYQTNILRQLLHSNTLTRIVNSEAYGNSYTINEMLSDVTQAIFKEDIKGTVSITRQNLQSKYVEMLIAQYKNKTLSPALNNALYAQMQDIEKMCKNKSGDELSKSHKKRLKSLIQNINTN